jgi:glycosyltransferase involved in cell wall biosynthesis
MRFAFLSATPPSVEEGSGTYVATATLEQGLTALGHRVHVIAPSNRPGPLGYTAHRFRFNRGLTCESVTGADVVVGFDMDGYRLAGRTTVPFVTYVHGQLADEARFERGLVAATMRMQARAERSSARRADRVITLSEYSRRRIADLYSVAHDRIAGGPPAFDAERWQAALPAPARSAGRPTVLCVARMYPRKNLASLVRATAVLSRRIPDVRVLIVGDGPRRGRLQTLVRGLALGDYVEFAGQLSFGRLVEAYASCDVFCLPTLQEGFGLVFLEAMAAGKPVVGCSGTAVGELVDDGVNGLLVAPGDDAALAGALHRLLTDEAARRAMGEANRVKVERFAPNTIARRFVAAVPIERETT